MDTYKKSLVTQSREAIRVYKDAVAAMEGLHGDEFRTAWKNAEKARIEVERMRILFDEEYRDDSMPT